MTNTTPFGDDHIDALAATHFNSGDGVEHDVWGLLVAVADRYLRILETKAADDPAPFFAGSTPLQATIEGLRENLNDMRESG